MGLEIHYTCKQTCLFAFICVFVRACVRVRFYESTHTCVCRCMSVCGHVGGKQCVLYHISQMVPMYLAIVYISAVP